MTKLKNGTVVRFHSSGSTYVGFIIGSCSYDNAGSDNAYVVRYIFTDEDAPRHPYTIVAMDRVEVVKDYSENFHVGGHWSATPDDRCDKWIMVKQKSRMVVQPSGKLYKSILPKIF